MPRFVLLEHDHPFLHWDLMLENGDTLQTWRLDSVPSGAAVISAEPLPDHRIAYLDYEGPVSRDRGTVKRVDAGEFTSGNSALAARSPHVVEIQLAGTQLRGTARICNDSGTLEWQPSSTDQAPSSPQAPSIRQLRAD